MRLLFQIKSDLFFINVYSNKNYRASSLTSEMSMNTSFDSLIGWAYSRTKNGDQGSLSKKEAYSLRYVNERVEIELAEFKEEIEKKFKISKVRDFVFPRKVSETQTQYGK